MRGVCKECGKEKMLHFCPLQLHCNNCEKSVKCQQHYMNRATAVQVLAEFVSKHFPDGKATVREITAVLALLPPEEVVKLQHACKLTASAATIIYGACQRAHGYSEVGDDRG